MAVFSFLSSKGAPQIVQGTGFGMVGDILIGMAGAFIGGWLLPQLGVHLGLSILAVIINAAIGALVLLLLIKLVRTRDVWDRSWGVRSGSRRAGHTAKMIRPENISSETIGSIERSFQAPASRTDIRRWRARAIECRLMRMQTHSLKARQRLLERAQSFEEWADRAECSLEAPLNTVPDGSTKVMGGVR